MSDVRRCESCFKGTAVHDIHAVSLVFNNVVIVVIAAVLCIPITPCILIMGLYSVLLINHFYLWKHMGSNILFEM